MDFMLRWLALCCASASASVGLAFSDTRPERVRHAVRPVLEQMAAKYNMSFSVGFTDANGRVGLAAGANNIWALSGPTRFMEDSLLPLGSVTKPWTAVLVMQAMERGEWSLDDAASEWIDPVLMRLWRTNLTKLWGANATRVRLRDLLGMTSGFADYNDFFLEHLTLAFDADDAGPMAYLRSAARQGFVCEPRTCAMYAGTNYVLLGLALVQLFGHYSWQDLNQLGAISRPLVKAGRYPHTSFLGYGRCVQYPGIAHQWAWEYWRDSNATQQFDDLTYASCLNGWTMGNIASTGEDLATFFYDLFTLKPEDGGFVNQTTLSAMQQYKQLNDTWCEGPEGAGSCTYGMGLLADQVGQDIWTLQNSSDSLDDVRIAGHPGEDWGSGCSPCGYNEKFHFGICIAYNSIVGMNCSGDFRQNYYAVQDATCRIYDAVLSVVGGARLNCSLPELAPPASELTCNWKRDVLYNSSDSFKGTLGSRHRSRRHPIPSTSSRILV